MNLHRREALLLLVVLGCRPRSATREVAAAGRHIAEDSAMTTPCPWKDVPLNQNRPCACSPTSPGAHWRGIAVNAPKQVRFKAGQVIDDFGAFAAVPLCVYYMLDVPSEPVHESYRITATDTRTGKVYQGDITTLDYGVEVPPPAELMLNTPRSHVAASASGGFMNPNLTNFVPIPQESATYEVNLSFRGFRSNKVVIQLIQQ